MTSPTERSGSSIHSPVFANVLCELFTLFDETGPQMSNQIIPHTSFFIKLDPFMFHGFRITNGRMPPLLPMSLMMLSRYVGSG